MEKYSPKRSLLWRWVFVSISLLVIIQLGEAFQAKCQREPQNTIVPKTSVDGGFRIKISGNPDKYVPGEVYTVSLQGPRSEYFVQKFTGFMLVVETASTSNHYRPKSVGTFQLYADVLTMHSEGCPNAVIQTSNIPKSEIQVLWTAPPSSSGCLRFKATVIEQRDIWYMDDGELTKELCENVDDNMDEQPIVIYDCCTCDEAKYEVTFEGLWSRQTHPKDFPANEWLTHFSDIIGASHSNDYRVWKYGDYASPGLGQVAEWGSTRTLESELKRESKKIRTIIKARGLWYPNVNGKTFAVFRVDNMHHLMSLVSMLGPSPDWIVGVSALELCMKNCSWVAQKTLNLYPWDAGIDSGLTYMSANSPTIPREKIRRITNSSPNDPKSPFYEPKGLAMKPLARLTITRQRIYEKSCSGDRIPESGEKSYYTFENTEDEDEDRPECATTEWGEFSPCSMTCGKGLRKRIRHYMIPQKADMFRCHRQLEQNEMCAASVLYCDGGSVHNIFGSSVFKPESLSMNSEFCQTSEWSSWTPCSATCGKGLATRSRRYLRRMGRKKCDEELTEKRDCTADILKCDDDAEEPTDPACAATPWTHWSPCSVTCGKGIRVRTRQFLLPSANDAACGLKSMDKNVCEGERRNCTIDKSEAKEVCLQKLEIGPCRGNFPRWFYDSERRICRRFTFGGCRGNRNNFYEFDECTRMCEYARAELHPDSTRKSSIKLNPSPHVNWQNPGGMYKFRPYGHRGEDILGGLTPENQRGPVVDCEVSPWSDWSTCSVTCGRGWEEQKRMIKVEPQNGGKSCPKKLVKRHKCKLPKCNKPNRDFLQTRNLIKFKPYTEYASPLLPSSNQLKNLMPSPPHQISPVDSEEDLMKEMKIDRENMKIDCDMGNWGPWSPCTHTCGSESLQQRARSIVVKAKGGGIPCGPSLERRYCTLPPCQHRRG